MYQVCLNKTSVAILIQIGSIPHSLLSDWEHFSCLESQLRTVEGAKIIEGHELDRPGGLLEIVSAFAYNCQR